MSDDYKKMVILKEAEVNIKKLVAIKALIEKWEGRREDLESSCDSLSCWRSGEVAECIADLKEALRDENKKMD